MVPVTPGGPSKPPSATPRSSHRRSQSTSALALIARDQQPAPPRAHRKRDSVAPLPAVQESAPPPTVQDNAGKDRPLRSAAVGDAASGVVDEDSALNDLRSLRSSNRKRKRALNYLEARVLAVCSGATDDIKAFVALQVHLPILALLGRHTTSLAKRASASALPSNDELARHLRPEIDTMLAILQGLTLLSRKCKEAAGERWAIEMFLDLLLLLRSQPAAEGLRPTAYTLLDMLSCVLVDSPEYARTFEALSGLEAVTRVLRGSDVAKDVRMKSCEFLYFWMFLAEGEAALPELLGGVAGSRSSSSLTAANESGSSFTTAQDVTTVPPSPNRSRLSSETPRGNSPLRKWEDLDLPFVPQTPRKPPKPVLGFQTPSAVRRASSSSTATTLTPVAASPDDRKSHRTVDEEEDGSLTRRDSAAWAAAQKSGLRVQREPPSGNVSDTGSHISSRTSSGSSSSSSSTVVPRRLDAQFAMTPSPGPQTSVTRSSTQPELQKLGSSIARRPSKRATKSPLVQSMTPESSTLESTTSDSSRPRIRHSRTQSALASLVSTPVRGSSAAGEARGPSRSRGFPSELTRGALPSTASPSGVPLTPARRVPSGAAQLYPPVKGGVRTVEEKKEMLGQWLGNVDELLDVQKGGFWANSG